MANVKCQMDFHTIMGVKIFTQTVGSGLAGSRLDAAIPSIWPELSRKLAQRIIKAGGCYLGGRRCHVPATLLEAGARLRLCVDPDLPFRTWRLDPAAVVHEDDALFVISKPSGVPVALSATGQEGSVQLGVEERFAAAGLLRRPAVIHRLDQPTSGLLVYGKTEAIEKKLYAFFRDGKIRKEYLAAVQPPARPAEGRIHTRIAKRVDRRNQYKVSRERGQEAETLYSTLAAALDGSAAVLAVKPVTGRSHQIRVHLAWIGAPILGDTLYGGVPDPVLFGLHAWRLALPHPATGRPLQLEAPLPPVWRDRLPWFQPD